MEKFDEVAEGSLTESDLTPELGIDAELSPEEITLQLADTIDTLAPFGMGNPEPVFILRQAKVASQRVVKESHLKLRLLAGGRFFDAIGFNMAGNRRTPEVVDVAFSLQINTWNGRRNLQLRLKDIKAHSS